MIWNWASAVGTSSVVMAILGGIILVAWVVEYGTSYSDDSEPPAWLAFMAIGFIIVGTFFGGLVSTL